MLSPRLLACTTDGFRALIAQQESRAAANPCYSHTQAHLVAEGGRNRLDALQAQVQVQVGKVCRSRHIHFLLWKSRTLSQWVEGAHTRHAEPIGP